jgi:hypothetical protein
MVKGKIQTALSARQMFSYAKSSATAVVLREMISGMNYESTTRTTFLDGSIVIPGERQQKL